MQMPGYIKEEIDAETGIMQKFWKNISDKIHFRKFDEVGQMLTKWMKIKGKAVEVPVDNDYFVENIDQQLLIDRILFTRNYSDMLVFQVMNGKLSVLTGLAHVKQAEIVKATKLNKGQVSSAIKRLKSPIVLNEDGHKLPELVREYEGDTKRPAWFVLNPEIVITGDHNRARELWDGAKKQIEAAQKRRKAEVAKLVQEIIDRINDRINAGEVESVVVDDELSKVKDVCVKEDVEFAMTPAWEDDF